MEIHIKKEFQTIQEFSLYDLPNFIVITGENGSGKTQLLNYLSANMNNHHIHDNFDHTAWEANQTKDNAFILVKGSKQTNITMIGVNQHYYSLGQNENETTFINKYGSLPHKYLSYLNLIKLNKPISIANLNQQFKTDIGRNIKDFNPNISNIDIELFNKIYKQKQNKLEGASFEECIVNLTTPKNTLFSTNLTFLYFQYHCRLKLGLRTIETPWDSFNKIMETANFEYKLKKPNYNNEKINCKIELQNKKNGKIVDVNRLSSGEKTIMSLLLALYNSKTDTQFPEVLFFDEPDSSLHPSMSQQMLDVLQNVFVKEKGVKVIMTTHSPSTIALTPEASIYRMDKNEGKLIKEEKGKAIKSLTKGLSTLNIYFENRKQVFVEADIDKYYFEIVFNLLDNRIIDKEIILEFISTGKKVEKQTEGGGCDAVKSIVNQLSKNQSIFGIIDFDNKDKSEYKNNRIYTLGGKNRHSLENYILDPLYVSLYILIENYPQKNILGFDETESIRNLDSFDVKKFQFIIDNYINKIKNHIEDKSIRGIEKEKMDEINLLLKSHSEIVSYTLVNNTVLKIPKWYNRIQGHFLEKIVLAIFSFLNFDRLNKESILKKKIIDKVIKVYPEFINIDIVETFKKIQESD